MPKILLTALLVLISSFVQAAEFEEGVHYRQLPEQLTTQTGDKIEVRELFWYHCPHCYSLEQPLSKWRSTMPGNSEFVDMPAVLSDSWEFHARVFYTFEALGILDQFHRPFFDAIHKKPRPLNRVFDLIRVAQWLEENGGPPQEQFTQAFQSFAVDTHTRNAALLTRKFNISGVPSIAVDGKYVTTVTMAGSLDNLFKVVEYLIELASSEKK